MQSDAVKNNSQVKLFLRSWISFFLVLGLIVIIFRYLFGIVIVSGNSMAPSLSDGQIIFANYFLFTPERGDIVIFEEDGVLMIKRVIALPGETIHITEGQVLINGKILKEEYITGISQDMPAVTVPEDSYFLIGDNRTPGESRDSRDPAVGPVEAFRIKGEAILSIYPFKLIK